MINNITIFLLFSLYSASSIANIYLKFTEMEILHFATKLLIFNPLSPLWDVPTFVIWSMVHYSSLCTSELNYIVKM